MTQDNDKPQDAEAMTSAAKSGEGVHTELRPHDGPRVKPAPRAKVMPQELDDDDDDLFNDMPV